MKNFNYGKMNAVHEDDLISLLDEYGLRESFEAGKLKCKYCKVILNRDNLFSIMRDSGNYKGICDKPECMKQLLDKLNESKPREVEI